MPYVELPLSSILDNPYFSSQPFPSELQLQSPSPFPIDRLSYLHEILSKSILFQILSAVAYLHTQKDPIAHRDINPGNFLLTPTGLVKLIDFSISWDPSLGDILIAGESSQDEDFYWKEDPKEMCVQIATGYAIQREINYVTNLKLCQLISFTGAII
jgi:cyclin-dependent kinase 8/11